MTTAEQIFNRGMQQGLQQGIQKGLQQGIQKGIQQAQAIRDKELMKNMRSMHFEPEIIARIMNLSVQDVLKALD